MENSLSPATPPNPPGSPASQNSPFEKRYKAFISYSHGDNQQQGRKWADWLHHSLETYEVPKELVGKTNQYGEPIPAQIYPVFQDEKELSANSDLSASLQQALDHAEFLVYLSSPRSARSIYVQEEIKHFKKQGKADKIIALILSGEPEYGDTQTERQCFPDALRYGVDKDGTILYDQHAEALAADVRLPHNSEEGFTSLEAYRRYLQEQKMSGDAIKQMVATYQERLNLAKLKIISTILGVPLAELTQRDQAYQLERIQRKNRNIKRVATAISVLAIIASGAGVYAWQQKTAAQKNFAQSLYTSGINKLAQNEYGDPAAYIAAAARNGSQNATEFAESMLAIKDDMVLLPNMSSSDTVFSPDSHYVAGFANQGDNRYILQLWNAKTRQKIRNIDNITATQSSKPFFDSHNNLYAKANNGQVIRYNPTTQQSQIVYQQPQESQIAKPQGIAQPSSIQNSSSNPANTSTSTPAPTHQNSQGSSQSFSLVAVSPDGQWLAIRPYDSPETVHFIKTVIDNSTQGNASETNHVDISVTLPKSDWHGVFFAPTSQQAVVLGYHNDGSTGQVVALTANNTNPPTHTLPFTLATKSSEVTFAPTGSQALLYGLNSLALLNTQTATVTPLSNGKPAEPLPHYFMLDFNPDGNTVLGLDEQGYDVYDSTNTANRGKLSQHQAVPLDNLRPIFEKDNSSQQISPDYTRRITQFNKQTYLQTIAGNPLIISEQRFAPNLRQVLANQAGNQLFSLSSDGLHLNRLTIETGKTDPNFIALPEAISYFDTLKNNLIMAVTSQPLSNIPTNQDAKPDPLTTATQKVISFYDGNSGQAVGTPVTTQARGISLNQDHSQFLARTSDNSLGIWQIRDGKPVHQYQTSEPLGNFITDKQFKQVLHTNQNGWQVVDIASQKVLLSGKQTLTNGVFSDDGKLVAIGLPTGQAQVYEVATGKLRFSLPTIVAPILKFSPDSRILLASEDTRRLRMWQTDTGKVYGQVIPLYAQAILLQFSKDSRKLFLQDNVSTGLAPAIKIIDTATGNLISLPFANASYNTIMLNEDDNRISTVIKLPDSITATIWQIPSGQKLPPEQLASDLETFYGRKYDPTTGAIHTYDGQKHYNTWFFQDIYTRSISPNASTTVLDAIERHIPIQSTDSLQVLSSVYFYHPLARAGLAEYFSRQPATALLSQRLMAMTRQQLAGLEATSSSNDNANSSKANSSDANTTTATTGTMTTANHANLIAKTNALLAKAEQQNQ